MTIRLHLPFAPVPKARPRFTKRGLTYTPSKTKDFEENIKTWARVYHRHPPIQDAALVVRTTFIVRRPKKAPPFPIRRPDIDNYQKAVFDALNGVLWKDDSLICHAVSKKVYGDTPGIVVLVRICT